MVTLSQEIYYIIYFIIIYSNPPKSFPDGDDSSLCSICGFQMVISRWFLTVLSVGLLYSDTNTKVLREKTYLDKA